MSLCAICDRVVVDQKKFCHYHQEALGRLQETFEDWRKASGIGWQEYLDKLCQIDETGQWVREVAEHIKSKDGPSTKT
jgi:hypothetical protein